MPGPAPKHPSERRRQNPTAAMVQLPAEGRKGRSPRWPLGKASSDEREIWTRLWSTPQAKAWERLGYHRVVARYARLLTKAEDADAPITLLGEVRQLEDRLGLTPMAMLRLRWEIVPDEVSEQRGSRSKKSGRRRRVKAVDPEAADG